MEIEIREERILPIIEEIEEVGKRNYEEAGFVFSLGEMDINKEQYALLQDNGNLFFFSFRKAGKLVGYAFYFFARSYMGKNYLAENGAFYLVPEERKGFAASRLLAELEKKLAEKGVQYLMHRTRIEHDLSALFERAGFRLSEKVYSKILKPLGV